MTAVQTIGTTQAEVDDFVLDTLPSQGFWREEDYLWATDATNRLIEYTDGAIEVLPMPTDTHQSILMALYEYFQAYVRPLGGKVLVAPLRVRIDARRYREPDLLLVRSASDPRRQNRFWNGADLALEVVIADKPERDLVQKRRDYAEGSISEYWIVNPLNDTITVLRLDGETYVKHGVYGRGSQAHSALLTDFAVDVSATFDVD